MILEWGRADRIKPEGGGMTSEEEATLFVKINDEVQSRMTGYTLGKLVTDKVPIYNSSNWHGNKKKKNPCDNRPFLEIKFLTFHSSKLFILQLIS